MINMWGGNMAVTIIIDDNEKELKHSVSVIENTEKFEEVYGFCYPEEAYNFIKEKRCDVLFMETEMKGINCFAFINKLRKINENIIFVIVTDKEEYACEAWENNILDYILKPLSPDMITRILKKLKKYYTL